jgi:hypothetical protein
MMAAATAIRKATDALSRSHEGRTKATKPFLYKDFFVIFVTIVPS